MSSLLISNAHLVTLDAANRCIDNGSVYIEDGRIIAVGKISPGVNPDRQIDAGGNVVMPAFINTHHHLYSTFARGFTPPGTPARNFEEILGKLWWKLDKALDGPRRFHDDHRPPCLAVLPGGQPRSRRAGVP